LQDKYNIGVLTVNIEFMWRGLETGERTSFSESYDIFHIRDPNNSHGLVKSNSAQRKSCCWF